MRKLRVSHEALGEDGCGSESRIVKKLGFGLCHRSDSLANR